MTWRGTVCLAGAAGCLLAAHLAAADPPNVLRNAGFDKPPLSEGWILDLSAAGKGLALQSLIAARRGFSLRLIPNENNTSGVNGGSFGLGQPLDVARFRGTSLYYSGWLRSEGDAVAVVRMVALSRSGRVTYREIRQTELTRRPVLRRDVFDVPQDENLVSLVLTVTVEGTSGAAYFDEMSVSPEVPGDWKAALGEPDTGGPLEAYVEIQGARALRRIPRTLYGINTEWVWGGQGIWNPTLKGFDPEIVRLTRELGTTVLRFPGGTFADFYHWEYGIGEREMRPFRPSLPGVYAIVSPNDFGIDELMEFCDAVGAEPILTVNVSTGSAAEAAAWVRYVNNGKRRVRYWEVGNELYVDHSLLDPRLRSRTPEEYAGLFLEYARAMRAADPDIHIGAIVDFNYGLTTYRPYPFWAEQVLKLAGPEIDFLSVHNGFAPALGEDVGWNARTVYASLLAAPVEIRRSLAELREHIERITGKDSKIQIAVSEWGPYFHDQAENRYIDHTKTLGSALYCASVLAALVESPRTEIANGFKLVDQMTSGWIGLREDQYAPKGPYFALQMFARHFGSTALETRTAAPGYDSRSLGWIDAVPYVPYVEVVSSRGDDDRLYIMAINKHFDRAMRTRFTVQDFCGSGEARMWTLQGTALDANTGTQPGTSTERQWGVQTAVEPDGRFHLGGPGELGIVESEGYLPGQVFVYDLPPHSVTALVLKGDWKACPDAPAVE